MVKGVGGAPWRQATVVFREDILNAARASGLDIDTVCNQALAKAAGIPWEQPRAPATPAAPVIVAPNAAPQVHPSSAAAGTGTDIHPVINADDPAAATTVKKAPRPSARKKAAVLPGRVSPATPPVLPAAAAAAATPETPPPSAPASSQPAPAQSPAAPGRGKAAKGSAIRRFMTEAVIRTDDEGFSVPKDTLYSAFTQWCREHRIAHPPDRKAVTVALKNQFAMTERTVDGEPSWVNARLR